MHPATFKKRFYQIRRFLKFINQDYLDSVRLPRLPVARVAVVTAKDVQNLVNYFYLKDKPHFLRLKAFILVMSTSGIRTKEAMQLTKNDLDLDHNKIFIRCDKTHTQKTGQERVVFITDNAKECLMKYLKANKCKRIFNESTLTRAFNHAPIRMKMLRKYFSSEWVRRNGNQAVKEILLGHSINGNVDLQHYLALSENELNEIYNKVMN